MVGRILMVVLSLPVLVAGSYGLLATYMPDSGLPSALQGILHGAIGIVSSDSSLAIGLDGWLTWPALRFALAPTGVVLLLAGVLPRSSGGRSGNVSDGEPSRAVKYRKGKAEDVPKLAAPAERKKSSSVEKRFQKKTENNCGNSTK